VLLSVSASGMVIVGAGEAGGRAALALREAGFEGLVTLIGEEPLAPYERPPLSKAAITCHEQPVPKHSLDAARCQEAEIAHLAGARAVAIDRSAHRVSLSDGRAVSYDRLLLATGARARKLPMPGGEHALYLRTFADALALREHLSAGARLAVIGGGFIGLEVTASAVERGATVTLIEAAPRLLSRGVPPPIAERLRERHVRAGVDIRLNALVERIEADAGGFGVVLGDGTRIGCDAVIAGIGAIPETRLAETGGLELDNGIAVDATFRTSDSDIFAAGDCCSFPHALFGGRRIRLEAWRNAQEQGAAAARSMLGGNEPYAAVPWFWSDQYDETLQIAGLPDAGSHTVERRAPGGARLFFHLAPDGRLIGASAVGANAAIAKTIRLAEMLIAAGAAPDPAALTAPEVNLKSFLSR
jgi:3-phenylpropionate/trans-cinnamate dioxygenase ferredoxin reductase subunit